MTNALNLEIDKNGVANLIFDLPDEKINKLSAPVLAELEKALNVIDGNKAIRILCITSKKDGFIAGADINEIKAIVDEKDAYEKVSRGQNILDKIANLKIPTIAIIKGACLGGGLELALACDYRVVIAHEKTSLGLPEVNLGIIPGFGGTQRLPKLVGLQESLKIILSGKAVDAKKSYKIGLADAIIREEFLENSLSEFVAEILANNQKNKFLIKRNKAKSQRNIFENLLFGKYLIYYLTQKNLYDKTKGFYIAPFYALEVVKKTYGSTIYKGLKVELSAFCELVVGDISKNLIEIFFTNEALKKDSGIGNSDIKAQKVENSAVIGAGIMGGGIAWAFANSDINVRIKDVANEGIAIGYKQVSKIFSQLLKIKKLTKSEVAMKTARISNSTDYKGFKSVDFAVEAVPENMALKKNILSELETKISNKTIIASNTSSLSITEMSYALKNPERFVGMHFFNPVNRMPLVEIIKGEKTSDEAIATAVALSKKLKKTPIVVKDVAGFLVNRILLPFMNEASYLLQDGARITQIDDEIEKFGMPMGPFVLADVVGIDVGVKVANSLYEAYGERMKVSAILDEIYNNHKELLGKKSNKGFYTYPNKEVNGDIYKILDKIQKSQNIKVINISNSDIVDRAILTMVNEASKCLEEKVVKDAKYLDMAMIMGAGFPAFRGGVLKYADHVGIKNIVEKLQNLQDRFGSRFEVSDLLVQMAQNNEKFYN